MSSNQFNQMFALVTIVTCFAVIASAEGLSCGSCGDECLDACGTRFFRTCCFNYLRKRSSPPIQLQPSTAAFDENGIWMNKAELEQMLHNEMMHQPKPSKKDEYQKTTGAAAAAAAAAAATAAASNLIPRGPNNHDQIRVVYEI